MRRFKRVSSIAAAAVLTFSSLMSIGFAGIAGATANNCTWTGATNNNFNTAGNWSSCGSTVPQAGDNLVFDASIITSGETGGGFTWVLNNDMTGLSVGTITFSGTSTSNYKYVLSGNSISLAGGIIQNGSGANDDIGQITLPLSLSADQTFSSPTAGINVGDQVNPSTLNLNGHTLTLSGGTTASCVSFIRFFDALSGSGSIVDNYGQSVFLTNDNSGFSGSVNVNDGFVFANDAHAFGADGGTTTVASGAGIDLGLLANTTFNENFVLSGVSALSQSGTLTADDGQYNGGCGGGGNPGSYTATLAGSVTLNSDITYAGSANTTVTGTYTSNGHKITVIAGANGTITTPDGTVTAPVTTTTVAAGDNQPATSVDVENNQTYVIDGQRGSTFVEQGGTLKGNGQVNDLDVSSGGTVAPGHSPGTLTVVTNLTLDIGSTYQAELKDKNAGDFDQIVVGNAADTTGNDVTLGDGTPADGGPTLNTSLYTGASIKKGDTFEIINNLSKTPVLGTFANLAEGATFTVNGITFQISYVGGDGNDVVLTALTVPTTPDTGLGMIGANPFVTLGVTVAVSGSILYLARKNSKLAPAKVTVKTGRK